MDKIVESGEKGIRKKDELQLLLVQYKDKNEHLINIWCEAPYWGICVPKKCHSPFSFFFQTRAVIFSRRV
jgi:hypothetical protein